MGRKSDLRVCQRADHSCNQLKIHHTVGLLRTCISCTSTLSTKGIENSLSTSSHPLHSSVTQQDRHFFTSSDRYVCQNGQASSHKHTMCWWQRSSWEQEASKSWCSCGEIPSSHTCLQLIIQKLLEQNLRPCAQFCHSTIKCLPSSEALLYGNPYQSVEHLKSFLCGCCLSGQKQGRKNQLQKNCQLH